MEEEREYEEMDACSLLKEIIIVHLLRRLLLHPFALRLPKDPLELKRIMRQASGQNAKALFTHLCDGAGLNIYPSQSLMDDRDSSWSDTNGFASDREITVTDADAGPALRTPPMQEIQYFIMRFMEPLTGRNAFAIDFWENPIKQAQIRDYMVRILHVPEVTRYAEISPHQILNNAMNN
ncbi:MAG: hypothetical protein EZS28_015325 [Streblomastix strix]|uniref:Uncharacterized protein n=1 Tax=Streblomastix strix TaxID=222440 RepID=A0A5J4W375_9EUKA|nr:MAG: hypothetical protein EZS28_015325 [Streblomastix strix]